MFCGRKEQLDVIFKAFTKSCNGETQVVLVGGEPTIGKTALCNAFYNRLSQDIQFDPDDYWPDNIADTELKSVSHHLNKSPELIKKWEKLTPKYLWLSAGCPPRSPGDQSYESGWLQLWLDVIKGIEGKKCHPKKGLITDIFKQLITEGGWEVIGNLTGGLPLFKTLIFDIPKKIMEYCKDTNISANFEELNKTQKAQAENNILSLLREISNIGNGLPTIIFLDDLQWANSESCRVLIQLCRENTKNKLLIIGTYRSTDIKTDTWKTPFYYALSELKRYMGDSLTLIELGGLEENAFKEFLKFQFNGTPDNELLQGLVTTMKGQPFFADHFCKLLIQKGLITDDGKFTQYHDWKHIEDMMESGNLNVETVIKERIDSLSKEFQHLLACGSSMGVKFTDEFLLKAMIQIGYQFKRLELANKLNLLSKDHKFINEIFIQERDRTLCEFAHIMIYQASLNLLSLSERLLLSEEVGVYAFERLRGDSVRELSFIESELLFEAFAKALEIKKSIDFLQERTGIPPKQIVEDMIAIVFHCYYSGSWSLSSRLCRPVINSKIAKVPEYKVIIARLEMLYAKILMRMGEYDGAKEIAKRYYNFHNDKELRDQALICLDIIYTFQNQLESSRKIAAHCIKLGNEDGNNDLTAYGYWSLGMYYEDNHKYNQALKEYDKIFKMKKELERKGKILTLHPYTETLAPVYRSYGNALVSIPERITEAEKYYLKALEIDDSSAERYHANLDRANLSYYYKAIGILDKALFYREKDLEEISLYSNDPEWACSYYNHSCITLMLGDLEKANESAFQAISIGEAPGGHQNYLLVSYFAQVCISLTHQKVDEAKEFIQKMHIFVQNNCQKNIPQNEYTLLLNQAEIALKLYQGFASSKEFKVQLEIYRNKNMLIDGCMFLGLSILPSVRNMPPSQTLYEVADFLRSVACETHNVFWERSFWERFAKEYLKLKEDRQK